MKARPSIKDCNAAGLIELTHALEGHGERMAMRYALIFAAGALDNEILLKELGSMERANWFEGRRAADPTFVNPYWPAR